MQQLDQARTVSAFRVLDPDYGHFLDLVRYMQPTQAQLGKFQEAVVLCTACPLEDKEIFTAFSLQPSGTNIHHDGVSCHNPAHQQHSGEQALPQPTTSEHRPLCHCGQWSTHPVIQRNEHHHHGKPQQGLQDCQRKGCEPRPWPWNNAGRRVPRQ